MRPEKGGAYRSNTPAICLSDLHVPRRGPFGWGGEWRGGLCVVGDTGCAAEEGGMWENVIHHQIRDQR